MFLEKNHLEADVRSQGLQQDCLPVLVRLHQGLQVDWNVVF